MMIDLSDTIRRIDAACKQRGWGKDWERGGCYIHLEVSEFIESLRGKGDDPPEKEAADVIITLCAVAGHYGLNGEEIIRQMNRTIAGIEDNSVGIGPGE